METDKHSSKSTKGEQTRERIIETATQLFVTQGYHATTTRQITDQLDLTRGTLYVHFKSKYEIFVVALQSYHPWIYIPTVVESAEGDTLDEFLHNAADRLLFVWKKKPEMIRLHLIELIEFQGRHLSGLFERIFSQLNPIIDSIQSVRPEFNTIPKATITRAVLGLFFAYLMTDTFTGGPLKTGLDDNMYDYFADAYLQGILKKGEDQNY